MSRPRLSRAALKVAAFIQVSVGARIHAACVTLVRPRAERMDLGERDEASDDEEIALVRMAVQLFRRLLMDCVDLLRVKLGVPRPEGTYCYEFSL